MMLRKNAEKSSAADIAALLKAAELALIQAVTGTDAMLLQAAGDLVSMQRRLRRMRYAIEVEAGIW